jgi:hypothetical protein
MIMLGTKNGRNIRMFNDLTDFRHWPIFTKINKCFLLRSMTLTLEVVLTGLKKDRNQCTPVKNTLECGLDVFCECEFIPLICVMLHLVRAVKCI